MLILQSNAQGEPVLAGLDCRVESPSVPVAKFDLTVAAQEQFDESGRPAGVDAVVEFATDLFDPETAEMIADHVRRMLVAIADDVDQPISAPAMIGDELRRRVLSEWNDTARVLPRACLAELFEARVARVPEAPALIDVGRPVSYERLNADANRLAHHLIGLGIGPEDLVAVAVPRSRLLLVALLGVLKTGAAYVPIDHRYPRERLGFIFDEASPSATITTGEIRDVLDGLSLGHCLDLEDFEASDVVAGHSVTNPTDEHRLRPLQPEHPAYVIYTSGSTGKPKGVVIPHRALTNFLEAMTRVVGLAPGDRMPAVTTIMFDIAVAEFSPPCWRRDARHRSGEGHLTRTH